jgi:FtsP/CotA-like multicopper oxidase with cupredoxin domain
MQAKGTAGRALVVVVSLALWLAWGAWRRLATSRVDAQSAPEKSPRTAHGHHLPPPTKGSELYQYSYPSRVRLNADQVFPPDAPPLGPSAKREYKLVVEETNLHEVAPGIRVPAWTFNGTVPGPVLRVREGEVIRVTLVNRGKLPHTIHFHGIHPAEMDGVFEMVPPGRSFTYEFVARPYGVFPYHCHSNPSSQHIHNGLYGMLIVDPRDGRPPMRELAMVMSAFDLDRDGDADFYAWNGKAFQYADHPIDLQVGEKVRMYVLNIFEEMMAPHIHGNMFQLIRSGTSLKAHELTDVVSLGIAERAILEFAYEFPGAYMFQCHFSEHMELGLMGWFRVAGGKGSTAKVESPSAKRPSHGASR